MVIEFLGLECDSRHESECLGEIPEANLAVESTVDHRPLRNLDQT
jgi:hypothetical protein